jgi:hypothetical protein
MDGLHKHAGLGGFSGLPNLERYQGIKLPGNGQIPPIAPIPPRLRPHFAQSIAVIGRPAGENLPVAEAATLRGLNAAEFRYRQDNA